MTGIDANVIEELKKISLISYLETCDPTNLVRVGVNVYSTKEHDSLRISNGKWMWWSRRIGGATALDYLIKVKDMSFLEAAHHLKDNFYGKVITRSIEEKKEEGPRALELPERNPSHYQVQHYLEKRGILPNIIEHCIENGSLYEDEKYHNAVFVGFDKEGTAKYAFKRSTGLGRFVCDCPGSSKQYSFKLTSALGTKCTHVHLFESAIDLLSYASLEQIFGRKWQDQNLLSLSGIYVPGASKGKLPTALMRFLEENPHIKSMTTHMDNDGPGHEAAKAIATIAQREGYRVMNDCPGRGKDVNEELCILRGFPIMKHQKARQR